MTMQFPVIKVIGVIILACLIITCNAVEYKVGDEITGVEIEKAYEKNNNEPLRRLDRYLTTLIIDDLNNDNTNDMLIENVPARGTTGNRSFGVFLGISKTDKYKYLGEIGSIVKTIKYENGNAYILESANAGGGHYILNLTAIRDGALKSAGALDLSPKEDTKDEDAQGRLVYLLRDVYLSEERILQIMKGRK